MSEPTPTAPPSKPKGRLLKTLLLVTGGALLLVGLAFGVAWYQARKVRQNLAVSEPLSITPRVRDRAAKKALRVKMERQAKGQQGRVRLTGEDASLILQDMLADKSLLGTLRRERKQVVKALADVPDPLGVWGNLQLEKLNLAAMKGEVAFANGQAEVRVTTPYRELGTHLNVVARFTGSWKPGAPEFELHSLMVGAVDLVQLTGYGRVVKKAVQDAIKARTADVSQRVVTEARLDGDRLEMTFRKGR